MVQLLIDEELKQILLWRSYQVDGPLETPCWEWQGSCITGGYGNLTYKYKSLYAHRASWEVHNGPIPVGMKVLHRCDFRRCINPEHLFIGTQADNLQDMANKGRDAFRNRAILTDEEALEIKSLLNGGCYSQREIGEMFGVSRGAVLGIHREDNWKHLWANLP